MASDHIRYHPRSLTIPRAAAVAIAAVAIAGCGAARVCSAVDAGGNNGAATKPFSSAIPLGAAVRWARIRDSPGYTRFLLAHYSWLTPENELKMNALAPERGKLSFATADALVDWARAHGKQVHGHVLVWGTDLPGWALALPRGPGALTALGAYIGAVMRHFSGRIHEWDVVNEAFTSSGSYVRNVWLRSLGPGYIDDAFAAARKADPSARLCYNDLGTELPGPHADAVLAMVRRLRRSGLIDCVGFELHTAVPGPDPAGFAAVLRQFAATGVELLISELDVVPPRGATDERGFLAAQAQVYGNVARTCRTQPSCRRITTWGFTDAVTWLGTAAQPLPFDSSCRAKPAWGALRDALATTAPAAGPNAAAPARRSRMRHARRTAPPAPPLPAAAPRG